MTPAEYITAARCPRSLKPQEFGLWTIGKQTAPKKLRPYFISTLGCTSLTYLRQLNMASMHLAGGGQVVMEDSPSELYRHMPIWLAAKGRVLNTGLGLGCVVRGLLANPDVEHIDVVEIDAGIIKAVGPEFKNNPRVTIHHADALKFSLPIMRWDYVWHDIHHESSGELHCLHIQLIDRFRPYCFKRQGAWMLPRMAHHIIKRRREGERLLGSPR